MGQTYWDMLPPEEKERRHWENCREQIAGHFGEQNCGRTEAQDETEDYFMGLKRSGEDLRSALRLSTEENSLGLNVR